MGAVTINGTTYEVVDTERRLIDFLRDDLKLYGTKEGCGIGRCGTCAVLVEGQPRRACRAKLGQILGKTILTIEGLGTAERLHPIQRAFIQMGAIQCGFCTPGMILTSKALLDRNPSPTEEDIRKALSANLCRCTGYVKIIDAVKLAAEYLRDAEHGKRDTFKGVRGDAVPKAIGQAVFAADLDLPGCLFATTVRSKHAHARIVSLDKGEALTTPGVVDVWTASDIPGVNRYHYIIDDQPGIAEDRVRFMGEAIAVVVGKSRACAEQGASRVKVSYEVLPSLHDPWTALSPEASQLHPKGNLLLERVIKRGDSTRAISEADVVVRGSFRTSWVEHGYLEPEAGVAHYDEEGRIVVRGPVQSAHYTHREVAKFLGVPPEKIRIQQSVIGGAFGGKIEPTVHCLLALSLVRTGRPIKMVWSREESFRVTTKRHPFQMEYEIGANKEGDLVALKVEMMSDSGAYASTGTSVLTRAAVHATGPYDIPNVEIRGRMAYTNNPIGGAMRGYGVPQVTFAMESMLDELAKKLGMHPLILRERNAMRPGSRTSTLQTLKGDVGFLSSLKVIQEERTKWDRDQALARKDPSLRRGIGCASFWFGLGKTYKPTRAGVRVELVPGCRFLVYVGATEVGQGCCTIFAQMAARALNHQPLERFQVVTGDSLLCPEAETTSGSRQTYFSGNALLGACQHLRERILERAAQLLGTPRETLQLEPDQVVHRTSGRTILLDQIAEGGVLKGYGSYEEQGPRLGPDQCKDPYEIYSYGTQMAEVEINVETGEIKVVRILSAHDSGNIVDLKVAEGQVEGGVAMGLGYALLEEFIPNQTLNYDTYHLPRTIHIPEIKTIFVTGPTPSGPLGAKGLGECPVVVTPAAIANAITQACGVRFFELPITPEKVRAALKGDRS